MMMGAIHQFYGFAEGVELAVNAGVDIVAAAPASVEDGTPMGIALFNAILAGVQGGRITEARIDESYARIVALKSRIPT